MAKKSADKKEKARIAIKILSKQYPDSLVSLDYDDPFQLLAATRLAAQCTDARVNTITPALFKKYPRIEDMAAANVQDVEKIIFSCGFYRAKASDLVGMANMIINEFGGKVPDTIEQLTRLPGVGRKTANIICGDVYGKPAIPADTHCIRISRRLGLTDSNDAVKVETQLKEILPPEESNNFCHRLVLFGRQVCKARKPDCGNCPLSYICEYVNNIQGVI